MSRPTSRAVEKEGVTKEDALRAALEELGVPAEQLGAKDLETLRHDAALALDVDPDNIAVRIVSEGTKGLLSLGSTPARVHVSVHRSVEVSPEETLVELLRLMGVPAGVRSEVRDEDLHLNIETDDAAVLIGRHGHTLDSIQYLLNCIVSRSPSAKRRVVVNAGAYREKREDMLEEMAHHAARRVRATGREAVLEPMNPRDRRIVHMALRDDEDVRTFSRGEGAYRAVIVVPKDKFVPDPGNDDL